MKSFSFFRSKTLFSLFDDDGSDNEPPEEDDEYHQNQLKKKQKGLGGGDDISCSSFEIIEDDEIAQLDRPFCSISNSTSRGSSSSLGSTGMGPSFSLTPGSINNLRMKLRPLQNSNYYNYTNNNKRQRPMTRSSSSSSTSSLRKLFERKESKASISSSSCGKDKGPPPSLTEEEMSNSTVRMWYVIQLKGHYNHGLEEDDIPSLFSTLEGSSPSNSNRKTQGTHHHGGWLSNLIHLPEKIKQMSADRQRLNVYDNVSPELKEQLKHLYVY